mmetsp:Transcript_15584/g.16172  ORF Transcript_15584/g.16172 Transcript_15584/m.16172 type:complete len:179 (+) Transcript_15584:2-538(+)
MSQDSFSCSKAIQSLLDSLLEEDICSILCSSYEELSIEQTKSNCNVSKIFYSTKRISLADYIKHIVKYAELEKPTLILAFILLDRMNELSPSLLRPETRLKLFIGACICAVKYNQDKVFSNSVYAHICGVSLSTFNLIETQFLEFIDYSVYVSQELWTEYLGYTHKIKNSSDQNSLLL